MSVPYPVLRAMGHDVADLHAYYGMLPDKMEIPKSGLVGYAMFQSFSVYEASCHSTDVRCAYSVITAFLPAAFMVGR